MVVDIFLAIDDVKGESKDLAHKDQIDVLGWNWGMTQAGGAARVNSVDASHARVQDLRVTKSPDKASPILMMGCIQNRLYDEAKLVMRKAGGKTPLEHLIITLNHVIVTSYTMATTSGQDVQTEELTLNFQKVTYTYQPQKQDGSKDGGAIGFSFNVAENRRT